MGFSRQEYWGGLPFPSAGVLAHPEIKPGFVTNSTAWEAHLIVFQSVTQSCLFATPWTAAHQASLSFTISWSLSNSCPLTPWCHPAVSSRHPSSLPALKLAQQQGLFQWLGSSKYWSFSSSISPSNEYSGLTPFRIDWLDLLDVQGTLKSLYNITIQKHQFFSTQPSLWPTLASVHDYWKTIAFTIWTFPITYKKAF